MNKKFKGIDDKLKQFAVTRKAEIHSTGSTFGFDNIQVPPDKIQERRITWADGNMIKIVHIRPNFSTRNINLPSWDFELVAWYDDKKSYPDQPPSWSKHLLKGVAFSEIYKHIDHLLIQSGEYLDYMKLEDLRNSIKKPLLFGMVFHIHRV